MSSQDPQDTTGQKTYQRGNYREIITPNASPRIAHDTDVFITANFIWWKTGQESTDYVKQEVLMEICSRRNTQCASKGHERSVGRVGLLASKLA